MAWSRESRTASAAGPNTELLAAQARSIGAFAEAGRSLLAARPSRVGQSPRLLLGSRPAGWGSEMHLLPRAPLAAAPAWRAWSLSVTRCSGR